MCVTGPRRRPVQYKWMPHVTVWQAKESSLINGHECQALVKICSHSLVMLTFPYEWKILKWDKKNTINQAGVICHIGIALTIYLPVNIFYYLVDDNNETNPFVCYNCLQVRLFLFRTTGPISSKLDTMHFYLSRIQGFTKEKPCLKTGKY